MTAQRDVGAARTRLLLVLVALIAVAGSVGAAAVMARRSPEPQQGLRQDSSPPPSSTPSTPVAALGAAGNAAGSGSSTPPAPPTHSPGPPAPAASATLSAGSLAGQVIVIDPGHNGGNSSHLSTIDRVVDAGNGVRKACNTTGTQSSSGYTEHAYTFDVAVRLAAVLRSRGATVVLTRRDDHGVGPCIDARAAMANRARAAVLISIHADGDLSSSARGFHVIRSTSMLGGARVTTRSARLALLVRSAFRTGTGMPYSTYIGGGTALSPRKDIGTLNLSRVPGVMIECGNMRQSRDIALLGSPAFRQRAAVSLAAAIGSFLAG
jgi:N-acetylmuramoyl-L-alanine amidase